MRLICKNDLDYHVSSDVIYEFESIILADKDARKAKKITSFSNVIIRFLYRFRKKFGFPDLSKNLYYYFFKPFNDKNHLFSIMMGWDLYKCLSHFSVSGHYKSIYLFDTWEKDHEPITYFIKYLHIDYVFVSSSQSAKLLRQKTNNNNNIHWIPEAIVRSEYRFLPHQNKKIDVLALGRKYDYYHLLIKDKLKELGITYLYEKEKGEIIFPTHTEFIEGLSNTKISICIPSSITHPERAGNIETMTVRYLQSMASKCLVLGHAPKEMVELFGYNPVLEIDYNDPVGQIQSILQNYDSYNHLIEKNYFVVVTNHTWQKRWEQIKSIYQEYS